jgi:asparagine synthase (glutamine-hydrolysing)
MFDVLRSDKCISSHGLEPRTPFLDRSFVNYYLSIHPSIRFHKQNDQIEKHLLRLAFSSSYYLNNNNNKTSLLPDEILWRKKEAFSDGISKTKSFSQIIESFLNNDEELIEKISNISNNTNIPNNTLEQKYYKYLFDSYYPNTSNVVPYIWMPKYIEATDPSARHTFSLLENI